MVDHSINPTARILKILMKNMNTLRQIAIHEKIITKP